MASRFQDWPQRLADAIEKFERKQFEWGSHDCGTMAADLIVAMTGEDPIPYLRGNWDSAMTASRIDLEAETEQAAFDQGWEPVGVAMARRGDLVLRDVENGPTLGIVDLDPFHAMFPGQDGIVRYATLSCSRAWRIP